MIPHIGYGELLLTLALALLLFGARRVPEITRALGRSIRDFKIGLREDSNSDETHTKMIEKKKEI